MWVFLNNAFLSIVQDKDNMARLLVRARLRGDIERAFPRAEVIETPVADYRFRSSIPRVVVSAMMQKAVGDIDYTNFKKSVTETSRHNTYLRVWNEMWLAQQDQFPNEPRVGLRFGWQGGPPGGMRLPIVQEPGEETFRIGDVGDTLETAPNVDPRRKVPPVNRRGKKAGRPRSKNR